MIIKDQNKIIRSLSGEPLRDAPIIDLDWRYGITKDGSNLVSRWNDQTRPYGFIQTDPAKQPTENGDGVVFNNSRLDLNIDEQFNFSKGNTIYLDFTCSTAGQGIIGRWWAAGTTLRQWVFTRSTSTRFIFAFLNQSNVQQNFTLNRAGTIFKLFIYIIINNSTTYCVFEGLDEFGFFKVVTSVSGEQETNKDLTNKISIGNYYQGSSQPLNGNLYKFQLYNYLTKPIDYILS